MPVVTTKIASSRLDNFNFNLTVILLFRYELEGPELRRRTPHHPELAKYSRFRRKGRKDPFLRLRPSRLLYGNEEGVVHTNSGNGMGYRFAKAVSQRLPGCAARVPPPGHRETPMARIAASPGSSDSKRSRHPEQS